jgi:hypothetical protein
MMSLHLISDAETSRTLLIEPTPLIERRIPFEELLNCCDLGDVLELVLEQLPVQQSLASSISLEILQHLLGICLLSSNLDSMA